MNGRHIGAAAGVLLAALGAASGAAAIEPPKLFGRIYLDYVGQDVDRQAGPDFDADDRRVRTARIGAEGKLSPKWSYKGELSMTDDSQPQWEDVLVEYRPVASTAITAGNFKSLGLENITSSRYSTFLEKGPYTDALDIGRVLGVRVKTGGPNWTLAGMIVADSINASDPVQVAEGDSAMTGLAVRGTWAPVNAATTKVHLGAWARARERQDGRAFTYRTRNNTNFGERYTSTGAIGDGDAMVGLEGLAIRDRFSLQGEWARAEVDRIVGGKEDFSTWYVAAAWYLTGEMRVLDARKGELGRTKVLRPVTEGGGGAWELAARYDNLDLTGISGAPRTAGEYSAWTLGANWHLTSHMRVMANYTASKNDNPAVGADVDVDTWQFRFQYDF